MYPTNAKHSGGLPGVHLYCWCVTHRGAYHSHYSLCEWCPLELSSTVPQLLGHDFILGNYLFPSRYSDSSRTVWAEGQRNLGPIYSGKRQFVSFYLTSLSSCLLPAWHSSLLTDSCDSFWENAFALVEWNRFLSPATQGLWLLSAWTAWLRSRVQGWELGVPIHVWADWVLVHMCYTHFLFLLILPRWHGANDLTLEAHKLGIRTHLSYLLAKCWWAMCLTCDSAPSLGKVEIGMPVLQGIKRT